MNNYPQDRNRDQKKLEHVVRTNWNIKNQYCRIIEQGKSTRIVPTKDAVEYAESIGLDLVEIGYDKQNRCSNCKVCDYGKYVYEQKQREKQARKQARANFVEIKNLQISLTTDTADLERIIQHGREFLADGDKIKIILRFRNRRESANMELAKNVLRGVVDRFSDIALFDSKPVLNGREFSCILRKAVP